MKKIGLLAIFILLMSTGFAQYKTVLFGFRVAPNMGWMNPGVDEYSNRGVDPGISWGFVSEFFLMEHYAIATGFNIIYLNGTMSMPYSMKIDSLWQPGYISREYKLKYIEIPLVLKMKTGIAEKWKLFGKVGLGTAFKLKGKAKDTFDPDEGVSSSRELDITDDIIQLRNSLILGIGFEYILKGSTVLVFDVTFNNGFTNFMKGYNPANPEIENKANNNFLELGIGILF